MFIQEWESREQKLTLSTVYQTLWMKDAFDFSTTKRKVAKTEDECFSKLLVNSYFGK